MPPFRDRRPPPSANPASFAWPTSHLKDCGALSPHDDAPTLLGTIGRHRHPLLDRIRPRPDATVVELAEANREALVDKITRQLPTGSTRCSNFRLFTEQT